MCLAKCPEVVNDLEHTLQTCFLLGSLLWVLLFDDKARELASKFGTWVVGDVVDMMLVEVLGKDGDKEEQHTDSCSIVDGMAEVVVVFVGVASEVIVVTME